MVKDLTRQLKELESIIKNDAMKMLGNVDTQRSAGFHLDQNWTNPADDDSSFEKLKNDLISASQQRKQSATRYLQSALHSVSNQSKKILLTTQQRNERNQTSSSKRHPSATRHSIKDGRSNSRQSDTKLFKLATQKADSIQTTVD